MHTHDSKHRHTDHHFDQGLVNLIVHRLGHGNTPQEIEGMLKRAGLDSTLIADVLAYVISKHPEYEAGLSQDADRSEVVHLEVEKEESSIGRIVEAEIENEGLFAGRLRRKDFIVGMLFFFGIGFIFLTIAATLVQVLVPTAWQGIMNFVETDRYGIWLMFIPLILAPVTVIVLSLIARRLHNLGLPGWISFLYLFMFVSPSEAVGGYSLVVMQLALIVLFILLLTKKGHPARNRHGDHPASHGPMFARILGK